MPVKESDEDVKKDIDQTERGMRYFGQSEQFARGKGAAARRNIWLQAGPGQDVADNYYDEARKDHDNMQDFAEMAMKRRKELARRKRGTSGKRTASKSR